MGGIASGGARARLSFIAWRRSSPACRGASTAHSEPRPVASPGESARADCSSEERRGGDALERHGHGHRGAARATARWHAKPAKDDHDRHRGPTGAGRLIAPREEGQRRAFAVVHRGGVLVAWPSWRGGDEDDDDDDDGVRRRRERGP